MRRIRVLCAISAVIALTILFHYLGWLAPVESVFRFATVPIASRAYAWSVASGGTAQSFHSVDELEQAYTALLARQQADAVDAAHLSMLTQENEELKAQLHFVKERGFTSVGARVIGKGVDPVSNTLLIDQGTQSGIVVGQSVIVGNGILIGKILRAERDSALIRLLQDPQSRMSAAILNADRTLGVLEGGYGIALRVNFIPQNETVKVDDVIVTSGMGGDSARGLVIGKVEAVEREPYEPFQRAIVSPLVTTDSISAVSVLVSQ